MPFIKIIKLNLKYLLNILSRRYRFLYVDTELDIKWFGNHYGGFYLFPDVVKDNPVILSFGIGEDISFDRAVSERFGCMVMCFDPTPNSINWFSNQSADLVNNLKLYEYGLSDKTHNAKFFLPKNKEHVSGSFILQDAVDLNDYVNVELKSIGDICSELNIRHIDVLKMDIEGAEYNVLKDLMINDIFVGQILVEFHDRLFNNASLKSKESVALLKECGYKIYAHSKSFEEVSFIHSSILSKF
jgi:FkbM family methyltransferase